MGLHVNSLKQLLRLLLQFYYECLKAKLEMKEFEHGGNIHKALRENSDVADDIIDFSANINPLGPPEWLRPLISSHIENLIHYPDPDYSEFVSGIAQETGINEECIVVGNGTTELLYTLMRVLSKKQLIVPVPSYVDYVRAARLAGVEVKFFNIREEDGFALNCSSLSKELTPEDAVVIATPNNPTGINVDRHDLVALIKDNPDTLFIIDEAFLDFIEGNRSVAGIYPNVITINSMTKFYGVPGLRVGYGVFPKDLASQVRNNIAPWTVNSFAQAVGTRALHDKSYQEESRKFCSKLRRDLSDELKTIRQIQVYPGCANYLFIKILQDGDSASLSKHCLKNHIIIRKCDNYQGLPEGNKFIRLAVRTKAENRKLLEVFRTYFNTKPLSGKKSRNVKSLMFQGTCSDAGKSILTAALCRILFQDGCRVAPFKSQNMSLNSFVTLAGDEMGRAQVVQAQAAKVDPDYRMNPILLKPNSDTGSQIIVCGKPVGNMSVLEYNAYKPKVWDLVCGAYDQLADQFDAIVLEGAGSPGEVNLKADDIVNMKMANYAEAPVILVGDIDRGGVYSSFVGIMEVLAEWERKLVAGYLVNKFRGQASLLESAHHYVKFHTGREVIGVVPYLPSLGLPEEDSVSFKKGSFNKKSGQDGIEIALINLPHVSNFTDIEPFLEEPDVSIRVIDNAADLGSPDAVIIPGSKNVIHDIEYLKAKEINGELGKLIELGQCSVIGICGGYQILGKTIEDPFGIESDHGETDGLGYLDMRTVIEKDKRLTRKSGIHMISSQPVYGYEIHHGISSVDHDPVLAFSDNTSCGTADRNGRIWGSYLHGIFDSDEFRRWFIDDLRKRKGLHPIGEIIAPYDLEIAFDRLADSVRESVDIEKLYSLMRL